MKSIYTLFACCLLLTGTMQLSAQGICNPAGNIILYSNYDGGNMTINIDENIPDIRIGICSYESIDVNITGAYAGNVTQVLYAGYNSGGGTSVTGVDAGIVDILLYPPVTVYDPDGYPFMICAYDCDSTYVPGGCNTVDQAVDYFLTELPGTMRYSYFQYGVYTGTYNISDGGNCCFGAACTTTIDAGQDVSMCAGDSTLLAVAGALTYSWSPAAGLASTESASTYAFPETTTTYFITGTDADGCVGIDSITVTVLSLPEPEIDITGTTLSTSGGVSYQWYLDGEPIAGATTESYTVTENGMYAVEVTNADGCAGLSNGVNMVVNAIQDLAQLPLLIVPNPAHDVVTINAPGLGAPGMLYITDALGRRMCVTACGGGTQQLDLHNFASGIYHVTLRAEHYIGTTELVITH